MRARPCGGEEHACSRHNAREAEGSPQGPLLTVQEAAPQDDGASKPAVKRVRTVATRSADPKAADPKGADPKAADPKADEKKED